MAPFYRRLLSYRLPSLRVAPLLQQDMQAAKLEAISEQFGVLYFLGFLGYLQEILLFRLRTVFNKTSISFIIFLLYF